MHHSVIQHFEGKHVEVMTTISNFTGILKFSIKEATLTINPTREHDQKRWVSTVIDQGHVVAIRELKPREEQYDGDEDCSKDSKYAKPKKADQ